MANGNAGRSIVGGINEEGTPLRAEWGTVSFRSVPRRRSLAPYATGTEFRTVEKGLRRGRVEGSESRDRQKGEREREKEGERGGGARSGRQAMCAKLLRMRSLSALLRAEFVMREY